MSLSFNTMFLTMWRIDLTKVMLYKEELDAIFIKLLGCPCISMQHCIVQRHLEKLKGCNAWRSESGRLPGPYWQSK